MVIKQGSTLVVPRNGQTPAAVASSVVNNAQVAFTPEVVLRRTVVRARRGDTIARVAARYDLPAGTVAGWNKSNAGAALKAGHAVVVYLPVRASSAAASESARHHAASRTSSSAPRKAVAGQARHGSSARKAAAPSARKAAPARSTAKTAPARPQKKRR